MVQPYEICGFQSSRTYRLCLFIHTNHHNISTTSVTLHAHPSYTLMKKIFIASIFILSNHIRTIQNIFQLTSHSHENTPHHPGLIH